MANAEHLAVLRDALDKEDISLWNKWLEERWNDNRKFRPNLAQATLNDTDLFRVNLTGADLTSADLTRANLQSATLIGTNLTSANLTNASVVGADLSETNLSNANFAGAYISRTIFADVDLSTVEGLESVKHYAASTIGIDTLYKSHGQIPEIFLRGCGVPDKMIDFAKSLVGKAIEYYSCFISYSSEDEMFARRLHNDLQANGVRVWFAPEDLKTGEFIQSSIDQAVRLYDKLILVLSKNSIDSAWVRHEFSRAIEKEKNNKRLALFPIRLDDSVFETTEQWAYDVKKRQIGDFSKWENPLLYQNAINRLFRDLKADGTIE